MLFDVTAADVRSGAFLHPAQQYNNYRDHTEGDQRD